LRLRRLTVNLFEYKFEQQAVAGLGFLNRRLYKLRYLTSFATCSGVSASRSLGSVPLPAGRHAPGLAPPLAIEMIDKQLSYRLDCTAARGVLVMAKETQPKTDSSSHWSWRVYTSIISIGVAASALLTWLISVGADTDKVLKSREAISEWIAPMPVSLDLRDAVGTHYEKPNNEEKYDPNWKLHLNVVGRKFGDAELKNCKGRIYSRTGPDRAGLLDNDVAKYSFPRGRSQQILSFYFVVPRDWDDDIALIRVACDGVVTNWEKFHTPPKY
jgi:hypothetical protein